MKFFTSDNNNKGIALAVALFIAVLLATGVESKPFDTKCPSTYYTREGLYRAEPFKGGNLGYFNCTGAMTTYDPATGYMVSNVNLPPFALHTIYNDSCGCWVTANSFSSYVVYEHGNELHGHSLEGTCFDNEFYFPGKTTPTKVVGFSSNIGLVHRDLPYIDPTTGKLAAHQTVYVRPNGDEVVTVRLIDQTTGVPISVQNIRCVKIASQP